MTSFTGVSSFPALLAMTLLLSLAASATATDAAAVLRAEPLSCAECAAGLRVASWGGSRGRGAAGLKLMAAMILASLVENIEVPQIRAPQFEHPKSAHLLEQMCSPSWFVGLGHGCCYCFCHVGTWMKNSGILPAYIAPWIQKEA